MQYGFFFSSAPPPPPLNVYEGMWNLQESSYANRKYFRIGPFPLTQIVALVWVAIRSATQISATIFIFMCGDRKVAIISAILIAIRAPLIVSLFENNRDYLKSSRLFSVRSVWERWTKIVPVFYIPSCKAGAPLSACVVCLQTIHMHSSLEPVRFGSRFFCLCGDTRKK